MQREWLTDTPLNTYVMVITSTWRTIGPAMVLFLIALQTIPRETIEAALLDGAGPINMFLRVKLPQIRPILVVVVTMSVVNSFATYDFVWVMTQGGPYQSSETLAVTIYRLAFSQWQVGFASALAVLLSLVTLAFSIIYIWRGIERQGSSTQGGSK
jgi:multiple sugar transport system permease protein